jgi:DNA-binding MarR family transcriptional regulator
LPSVETTFYVDHQYNYIDLQHIVCYILVMNKKIHPEAKLVASAFFPTATAFLKLMHNSQVVPKDLTPQQMKIIMELNTTPRLRVSDLSRCTAVTHGTMVVAVQKLLKKGLLVKTKSLQDERAVSLSLTPQGKKVSKQIEKETQQLFNNICQGISKAERKRLVDCYHFLLKTYQKILQEKGNSTNG